MNNNPMRDYFYNIWKTSYTILVGMRVSLKYCFAKTVTVQYPDVPPVVQPRFRGLHSYEIERCAGCGQCAKACPVDCIYVEKSAPRKLDKKTGLVLGGAMTRFAIDYSKCMFCGLCVDPCPTDCLHMGNLHDLSSYDRKSMVVEFTELSKEGLQAPEPLWMRKEKPADWIIRTRDAWRAFEHSDDKLTGDNEERKRQMSAALEPSKAEKKDKPEEPAKDD